LDIQHIKKLYAQNTNLTEYFKTTQNKQNLSLQEIELIYDLQSGNYSKNYQNNPTYKAYKTEYAKEIVQHIKALKFDFDSILEAGIGEATTFVDVIKNLNQNQLKSFGVDVSWSRLAYAKKFLKHNDIKKTKLATGLLENLPFLDNCIDIVYTSHSIEPNRGKEQCILKELYRVTKNYLILLEPSYELGCDKQKKRMDSLAYAKNLLHHCQELGYNVIQHELLKNHSAEHNKTSIIIIEKSKKRTKTKDYFACPQSKTKLFKNKNFYYSAESFYSYPILEKIACLNSENKILSTKIEEFITLHKTHPRYNEQMFLKSLEEPIDEKIKDMYCPNAIGFLATEENLADEEFVGYIKELMVRFPDVEFKGFCFNKSISNTINKEIKLLEISSINEIILNTEIFIWDLKGKTDLTVVKYLLEFSNSIFNIFNFKNPYFINLENKSLKEYDKFYSNRGEIIITNPKKFGFTDDEIENTNRSYTKLMYESLLNKSSKDNFIIDLEQDALEFLQFKQIEFALKNRQFKEDFIKIHNIRNFK
jgi:ubiquinone/menaquinone biosynthesis C-methylase UbiE